jgi:hypothetical protein
VKLRATDLERIAEAFAKAWAEGDLEAASGWANAAVYSARRANDRIERTEAAQGPLHTP